MSLGVGHDIVSLLSDVILSLSPSPGDATQPCCPCIVLNCGKRVSPTLKTYTSPTPIPSIGMRLFSDGKVLK